MNLLIIDDNDICSFITNRVAHTSGIFTNIKAVRSGNDALKHIAQALAGEAPVPHVILLDLNMPVLNGFEFIMALRQLGLPETESIAIIVLSSSEDAGDVCKAMSMGVQQYLTKPLTVNQLQETIFSLDKKVWKRRPDVERAIGSNVVQKHSATV